MLYIYIIFFIILVIFILSLLSYYFIFVIITTNKSDSIFLKLDKENKEIIFLDKKSMKKFISIYSYKKNDIDTDKSSMTLKTFENIFDKNSWQEISAIIKKRINQKYSINKTNFLFILPISLNKNISFNFNFSEDESFIKLTYSKFYKYNKKRNTEIHALNEVLSNNKKIYLINFLLNKTNSQNEANKHIRNILEKYLGAKSVAYKYENYISYAISEFKVKKIQNNLSKFKCKIQLPILSSLIKSYNIFQFDNKNNQNFNNLVNYLEFTNYWVLKNSNNLFFHNIENKYEKEFDQFKNSLNFIQNNKSINKEIKIKKDKVWNLAKNKKIMTYFNINEFQDNYDLKYFENIDHLKTKINLLLLNKTIEEISVQKIVNFDTDNWPIIKKKLINKKYTNTIMNINYKNIKQIINELQSNQIPYSIKIDKMEETFFDFISYEYKPKIIVIGKNIAENIKKSEEFLWLSYLNVLVKKKKILIFYENLNLNKDKEVIKELNIKYFIEKAK